ncbi:MAG: polysaccharide biosynthesis/export family protein [Bacteroidales bacterium]|nr:polysaccharide biosynthesis/export family protein [Candidatus Cacconaster merdequi]
MKRIIELTMLSAFAFLLVTGCATQKEILYFQDIDDIVLAGQSTAYEAVIKKDDCLSIVVSGPDKSVTLPYNLTLSDNSSSANPESATLSYLVDPEGNINFPTLGTIHVEGMTRNQLVEYLTNEIGKDVKDPIVYVSFKNYKITILGEVKAPGTYTMDSEKVTLLQALGRAGDLTLNAKREGIVLAREVGGKIEHYTIDLKSAKLFDSPYYYLQQNDVVYVPASATRVASATAATGLWSTMLSSITTILTIVTFILTLTR